MKLTGKRVCAWLIVLAVLLSVTGCDNTPETPVTKPTETTAPPPTEDSAQQDLAQKYDDAVALLTEEPVGLEVQYMRKLSLAGQDYHDRGTVSLGYWNWGTEDFLARAQRVIIFGNSDYTTDIVEIYSDGKMYQTLDKDKFYAEISAEEFVDRFVPVKMLDPTLYTLSANEDGTQITFADPTAGESWLIPEDAVLCSASGTVELNDQGELEKTAYTVTYQYGPAEFTLDYQVSVSGAGREPVVPKSTTAYVMLDEADAVYALEHAYGYLSQATHVSTTTNDLLLSAAAGYAIQSMAEINAYDLNEEYAAKWETNISVMNYASGQDEEQEVVQKFIDGKYTMSVDGGREETISEVTQKGMMDSISGNLSANIIENDCIASVESTNLGSVMLFAYTGTEEMGKAYCEAVCTTIYQDPNLLNEHASSYETNKMEFYLALDSYTLLPVAAGVMYEGKHIIEGEEYILSRQTDQSFDLASLSAYHEIFEKPAAEEEPEVPATPLFYHVTGKDGQEMWLLGTIHVGDERTAYLPDEIYDALLSSDALAIECNQDAFEEQLEEDEELRKTVSDAYYYSDGTTIKDHLVTPDLYEDAVKMMKATGNYNFNAEHARPSVWSSSISAFCLQQGYGLTREKGVEERLLDLVEENGIPIWEVESTLFQIQMDSKYSPELQEVLLFSVMGVDTQEYAEESRELYELWCAGDEEALREEVKDEPWELKEEDFTLEDLSDEDLERAKKILADLDNINAQLAKVSEEYEKAMSVDRNEGMLKVAKEYLESGDVVFYAVGLAHLLAENGLVNTLRDAGYTVELVNYS